MQDQSIQAAPTMIDNMTTTNHPMTTNPHQTALACGKNGIKRRRIKITDNSKIKKKLCLKRKQSLQRYYTQNFILEEATKTTKIFPCDEDFMD